MKRKRGKNMAKKNTKRFLLLFALGIAYGFMYVMPYNKVKVMRNNVRG